MSAKIQTSLSLAVYGAGGRMGTQVLQVAGDLKPPFKSIHPVRRFSEFKEKVDVVIDFSLPQGSADLVEFCRRHKTPLVSGTTGLSEAQMKDLKNLGNEIPVLWSPNMSLGVMVVSRMLQELKILSDWTFLISETHHVHKKDRPSGTALRLQEVVEKTVQKKISEPHSLRQGEVIGDHIVRAVGPFEEISIEHRATDRRVFAQGAVQAALWLVSQPAGFYSLRDMVNTA